jgi:CheY-like chemotaxis protein/HPt (histidine-containing phosphotransfer) domain-containing protein
VKLVAVSASVLKHEQERYADLGFDAFIGKPLRFEQVCACLEQLLCISLEDETAAEPEYVPRETGSTSPSNTSMNRENDFDPTLAKRCPLSILVADDFDMNQKLVARILQGFGYDAQFANNGVEAIQQLEKKRFDLVFLDVQMPEMDGYETARTVRARWSNSERPRLIAMTANALRGDREKCLEAGMDEFISKPVQIGEIRKALQQSATQRPPVDAIASNGPATIDCPRLDQMFGGDSSAAISFLHDYVKETTGLLQQLRTAVQSGNASEVELLAHRSKGASANFGILAMLDPTARLEAAAESGNLTTAEKLLTDIETAFRSVESAVQSRKGNLGSN